jgi:TPR repeat protein
MMADLLMKDDPEALFLLGNEYHDGTSAHPRDEDKAVQLWEAAARKGHVQAALLAANYFLEETKEPSKGFGYMLQAAEAGDARAQLVVSRLYAFGHGCVRDEGAARAGSTSALVCKELIGEQKTRWRALLRSC